MLDQSQELDRVFHALSHGVRREVLRRIAKEEVKISDLAEPFDMTLEGVSQHIRVLEKAGLLRRTRRGRAFGCVLEPKPLKGAASTIAQLTAFWGERFDALEQYVTEIAEDDT